MTGPRIAPSLAGYIPAPAGSGPQVAPRRGILSELENLSYGIGQGQVGQLEGYEAMIRQPAAVIAALYRAASNPRQTITAMAADAMQKARGGPIGIGQLLGESFSPRSLLGVNAATAAIKKPGLLQELDVYHGTPHRFLPTEANPLGEFDATKIGTGEGAQVYGDGVYLAQRRGIGQSYKDNLSVDPRDDINDIIRTMAPDSQATKESVALALKNHSRLAELAKSDPTLVQDVYEATRGWDVRSDTMSDAGIRATTRLDNRLPKGGGSLYTADLPDDMVDRMIDWDKPINEQSKPVLDALEKAGINTQSTALAGPMARGQEAHLAKHGIPGIRYLDAGSRDTAGKWVAKHPMGGENAFNTEAELNAFLKRNPEMTALRPNQFRNFVVFPGEEKRVRILKRE
jgi:hypothetical protein